MAGKSVVSLLSDGPKGERDPIFEFFNAINSPLLYSMVYGDDYWRDTIVETTQEISEKESKIMNERQQFIEEMRSRF